MNYTERFDQITNVESRPVLDNSQKSKLFKILEASCLNL